MYIIACKSAMLLMQQVHFIHKSSAVACSCILSVYEFLSWHDSEARYACLQPILKTQQNGEGFYYIVRYKRRDVSKPREITVNITGWQQSEFVIDKQELFKEYEISVQSANAEGLAPSHSVEIRLGFSGQAGMLSLFL